MSRLKKIMGTRTAGVICFLFAIVNRVIFTSLYSLIGVDTKLQLTYAENLMTGRGFGATKYFTNDLNTPVFDTQQYFPPGFSLAIIPFLKLFGGDEYKAVLAFDIIVAVLFVFAVRFLGKKAGLSPMLNNIVTLVAGCSQYFFFMSWSSTDAISLCFVLIGLAVTIDIINRGEAVNFFRAAGWGLLFCLPFFFRYMYLPIAGLLPLLILLAGIRFKNKNLKTGGLGILACAAVFLILFFVYRLSVSVNALYITNVGRGLFIDQFSEWYPFLPASFINIDFGAQLLQTAFGIEYSHTIFFLKIINTILVVLLLILFGRYIYVHRNETHTQNHFLFIIIGSVVSVTILLMLSYLTLTYKELSWGYYRWTFVQDPRYFGFIYVFVPMLVFVWLQYYSFSRNFLIRFILFAAFCCLGTEIIHGIYYNVKILQHHKDLAYIRDADEGFKSFPAIIKGVQKQNPDRQLIVCSPDNFYLHTASQMGYKAIFDYDNFLKTDLKVSEKTILIMPIQTRDEVIINDFIRKKNLSLFLTLAGTSFYTQEIDP